MSEPSLFDGGRPAAPALYYATNRLNVREIFAGRFIAARQSYDDKYYSDFLEHAAGRVPLFTTPGRGLLDVVTKSDPETAFPVILELDASAVETSGAPALCRDGKPATRRSKPGSILCYAPSVTVSTDALRAVHFRDEDDLTEFSIRGDEFRSFEGLFRASPQLFAQEAGDAERVTKWLGTLEAPLVPATEDFIREDRVGGGVLLALQRTRDQAARDILIGLADATPAERPERPDTVPAWFSLGLRPMPEDRIAREDDVEARLFAASVAVFHRADPKSAWRPAEVLDEVRRVVRPDDFEARTAERLGEVFERARRIIRDEAPFERFKSTGSLEVAKALLLVLKRREPGSLLMWSQEDTGADDQVMMTAAAFSGLLKGRKGLPVEYRDPDADADVARRTIRALESASRDGSAPSPAARRDPLEALMNDDLAAEGPVRTLALEICREMDWRDCVTTVLECPTDDPVMQEFAKVMGGTVVRFAVRGFAAAAYRLDEARFRQRLQVEELPKKLQRRLKDPLG